MKVNCIEDRETQSTGAVIITLENGNQIHILELDDGVLKIENITGQGTEEFSIMIMPESAGSFTITPEGK